MVAKQRNLQIVQELPHMQLKQNTFIPLTWQLSAEESFKLWISYVVGIPQLFQEQQRLAERQQTGQQQQLFQLRSIKSSITKQQEKTKARQKERKAKQEAQKSQPRRLGRLKYVFHLQRWSFESTVDVQQLCFKPDSMPKPQ